MVSFLITIGRFVHAIWRGLRDPEFRALLILVVITLLTGTLFYAKVEGWRMLDAFYFSFITLTTIGFGDLVPTTPGSKIFTMIYVVVGIGILLGFIEMVARNALIGKRSTGEKGKDKQND